MVTVIDNVKYLPEDKHSFFDVNGVFNETIKSLLEMIKMEIEKLGYEEVPATVVFSGTIRKENHSIDMKVKCENDQYLELIEKTFKEHI